MSDEYFFIIYFSPLFLVLIIGTFAIIIGNFIFFRTDFSFEELKLIKNKSKKNMIISFIVTLIMPTTIIPLYIVSPRIILIIQFFIMFFSVISVQVFFTYFQRFILAKKKLRSLNRSVN